jgi:CBS domain-containing membrane protein
MLNVSEIMTTYVITLKADDTLKTARELMSKKKIRHIPIVNEKLNVVGLLSQRDLLKSAGSNIDNNLNKTELPEVLISEVMTKKIKFIYPDDRLITAGVLMEKNKFGCLPVIDDEKLVGIITDTDFVAVAINLLEQVEEYEETEF